MATKKRTPRRGFSAKKLGTDLQGPGTLLLGLVGTALLDKVGLSKVPFLEEKETTLSKFIKPAVIVAIGVVGRQMVGNTMVKTLLDGMTVYGGIKAVNAGTGKDVMTGLSGITPYSEPRRIAMQQPVYYPQPELNGGRSV